MTNNIKIKHCKKCLMPNTRPGAVFNEERICQSCLNYEKRKNIDWQARRTQLKNICDKHRRNDGSYDCLIPVSGGKDSTFLVYMMKEKMGMNPLLVTVGDPFTKSKAGTKNLRNLKDTFNCDHIQFDLSIDLFRRATKITFEKFGEPLRFVESAIYTSPIKIAIKLGIPLMVYGENSDYEYGFSAQDNYSAKDYISKVFKKANLDFWLKEGFSKRELNAIISPTEEELKRIETIFMSYFDPWGSTKHLKISKRYGFITLANEWQREGFIDDFEQIDSIGYMVHHWMKYPKFGFQRTSDVISRFVREGIVGFAEAKKFIAENDYKLDQLALEDFLNFCKYSPREFWEIVEKYWNPDLFEKVDEVWQPKFNYEE